MSNAAATRADVAGLRRALADAGVDADANPADYAVADAAPDVAARPATVEEASATLAAAARHGAAVVPWGGGTRMGLGAPPTRYNLALDLRGLDRVVNHEPADLTVTVEAGCTVDALQRALGQAGQWLPLDPPMAESATIGGTLATGVAGPLSAGVGSPRELVIGMRALLADGTLVKSGGNVVKNVTGYAMDRLYVGALGTLAVIVEATFKIVPLPRAEATFIADFPTPHEAASAWREVSAAGLPALAVEALSPAAWFALSPMPPYNSGPVHRVMNAHGPWRLAVRLGGRESGVARATDTLASACGAHGAASTDAMDGETGTAFWRRVADLRRRHSPPPLMLRAAVPPSQGPAVAAELGEALGGTATVSLTLPRGVVSVGWPVEAEPLPALGSGEFAEALGALRERIAAMGGTLTVEATPPLDGVDPWGPPGEGFDVMRRLKEQFDPHGVLNPGRFLGGL